MGRSDPAPSWPGRGPGSPAGWIVAGVLAAALVALVAFEIRKRAHVDREARTAVVSGASPAPPSEPAGLERQTPAPFEAAVPEEGGVERVEMEVTPAPSLPLQEIAGEFSSRTPEPAPSGPPASRVAAVRPCHDQAAALLLELDPLIREFKREKEIAVSTPRISLAAEVSKLDEVSRRTQLLSVWPETVCGYRLREKVLFAEEFEVERLKDFMGGFDETRAAKAEEAWDDVERELREIRAVIRATSGNGSVR